MEIPPNHVQIRIQHFRFTDLPIWINNMGYGGETEVVDIRLDGLHNLLTACDGKLAPFKCVRMWR